MIALKVLIALAAIAGGAWMLRVSFDELAAGWRELWRPL